MSTISGEPQDRVAELARIDVPVLAIAGRRDHAIVACAEVIADGVRDGQLVVLEAAAHNPFDETPEQFTETCSTFLLRNAPSLGASQRSFKAYANEFRMLEPQ